MESIFDWPGKSDGEGNERPAVLHMLDVAACAEWLIEGHTAFGGLSDAQRRALVVLVALHDAGKLSAAFRAPIRAGEKRWPIRTPLWMKGCETGVKKGRRGVANPYTTLDEKWRNGCERMCTPVWI